jgi:hypothetical protein
MGDNEWSEVEDSNFWEPKKENDEIQGVIISKENGDYGIKVIIETSDKKQVVLPSHKVLQNRLQGTKPGDLIRVVYIRQELPSQKGYKPTNIYKVFTKEIK